jgi:hypothetical protein
MWASRAELRKGMWTVSQEDRREERREGKGIREALVLIDCGEVDSKRQYNLGGRAGGLSGGPSEDPLTARRERKETPGRTHA